MDKDVRSLFMKDMSDSFLCGRYHNEEYCSQQRKAKAIRIKLRRNHSALRTKANGAFERCSRPPLMTTPGISLQILFFFSLHARSQHALTARKHIFGVRSSLKTTREERSSYQISSKRSLEFCQVGRLQ